jgi:hypothetical protein
MHHRTLVLSVAAAGLWAGCLPVGNYHSARTLGEGESSIGLTVSATTYTVIEEDPNTGEPIGSDSLTVPGVIPEIAYHIGITDDVELGGRIAPGFLYGELDAKFRFFRSEGLHLAVAPAVGQAFVFVGTMTTLRLPLLLTYELHPRFAFNAGINATLWQVSSVDEDGDLPFTSDDGTLTTAGLSLGLEIVGDTAFLRPSIEIGRGVYGAGDRPEPLQIAAVVLHFGQVSGRELKKLDEMDRKLDEINGKLSWRSRHKPAHALGQLSPSTSAAE